MNSAFGVEHTVSKIAMHRDAPKVMRAGGELTYKPLKPAKGTKKVVVEAVNHYAGIHNSSPRNNVQLAQGTLKLIRQVKGY